MKNHSDEARHGKAFTGLPKCGEEKLWRSDTNPNISAKKGAAYAASRLVFGWLPSSIIASSVKATMVYKCGKCGFSAKYKEG